MSSLEFGANLEGVCFSEIQPHCKRGWEIAADAQAEREAAKVIARKVETGWVPARVASSQHMVAEDVGWDDAFKKGAILEFRSAPRLVAFVGSDCRVICSDLRTGETVACDEIWEARGWCRRHGAELPMAD